jgi:ribose transport system substrate-binding protein
MAETLDKNNRTAILLRYRAGSESTEQRERGFLDTMAKEFPDVKIVSSDQHAGATTQSAMNQALQLLLRHSNVGGFFAVCEPNCNGTLEALEQAGVAGKVKFIAFDPSDRLIHGLKEGSVHGIVLQDPVKMGYTSVKTIAAHLKGEKVKSEISTGEYVATAENMNTAEFKKLLNPEISE